MHPAYSVILFTTASGAGLGLLVWLCLFAALGLIQPGQALGLIGFGLALGLTTVGLLSSTFHLGHPERAWRAFSQWRSSWLSREGVAAVATFPPAGLVALAWIFGQADAGWVTLLEILTVIFALATLWCTGMIYACLTTIRAWNHPMVPWIYVVLGLATGAILLTLILFVFGQPVGPVILVGLGFLVLGLALKISYWHQIDNLETHLTPGDATGLKAFGQVRVLDPPHTMDNYVMREMGYAVGRKHAAKLRTLAIAALFVVAPVTLALSFIAGGPLGTVVCLIAVVAGGLGVVIERWLFFAEAKHAVTLYYGAQSA